MANTNNGFPIWSSANAADTRLKNAPRTDWIINDELRGLNNKYSLHHYPRVGDLDTGADDHAVGTNRIRFERGCGPVGCKASTKGEYLEVADKLVDRMTGTKPSIGNPTVELDAMVAAARDLLAQIGKP